MGAHWRAEYGCVEPTTNLIYLSDDLATDRCPLALFRDAPREVAAWGPWAAMAAQAWETGNLAAYLGGEELSAVGWDALTLALGALRERERAEFEAAKKERDKHGASKG